MPGNIPWPPPSISSFQTPDYDSPPLRSWLPTYGITLHIISTLMIVTRFAVRAGDKGGSLGYDDLLLLPAWTFAGAIVGLAVWSSNAGLIDRHFWDVPKDHYTEAVALIWLGIVCFIVGSCLLRCSALLFYRRLQADVWKRRWIVAIWCGIGITIVWSLSIVLALDLTCQPTQALWKSFSASWQREHEYTCSNILLINFVSGILGTASDALTFLLPCFMLYGLCISDRQRLQLYGLFALNLVVIAAGAARTWALYEFSNRSKGDITWYGFWIYFWSITEFELGLISASLPSVRILFAQYLCAREVEESRNSVISGWRIRSRPRSTSTLSFGNLSFRRSSGSGGLRRAVFGIGMNSMPEAFKAPTKSEVGHSSEQRLKSAPIFTSEGARLARKYTEQVERYQQTQSQPSSDQLLDQSPPAAVVIVTPSIPSDEKEDVYEHDAVWPVPYQEHENRRSDAGWPLAAKEGMQSRSSVVRSPSNHRAVSPWIFGIR